jgi:GAF domain-containing protein
MPTFTIEERVRWSDVDAAGIICYGAYTRFLEAGEMELFRAAGIPYRDVFSRLGIWLPRVHMSMDFLRPAYLDDLLSIDAGVDRIGRRSVTLGFDARRKDEESPLMRGRLVLATVGKESNRPIDVPAGLSDALRPYLRRSEARPSDPRAAILRDLDAALASRPDRTTAMNLAVDVLHARLPHFRWTGFYLLDGETLVLGPYRGASTEHVRIPIGRGLCGTAVAQGRNLRVDDVTKVENYLACSTETRSELVVLVRKNGRIVGQIDVDGDTVGAFGAEDERLLEAVAERVAPLL